MARKKPNTLQKFIDLYSRGLSRREVESLITRETAQAFFFYERGIEGGSVYKKNGKRDSSAMIRGLAASFVMSMRPARRLVYGVAIAIFVMGFVLGMHWMYTLGGFLLVNFLLALELADKLMTKDELEIARAIQFGLQPREIPVLPGFDLAVHYQPAREVGGDYYDFAMADNGRLAMMMGDVSGKGMAAALYAVKLQGIFQLLARACPGPKPVLERMNTLIAERMEANFFITAALAVIDQNDHSLQISRAGHNPPLLVNRDGQISELKPAGMGLNVGKPEQFDQILAEDNISLTKGDLIVFYTDGLTEAMDRSKEPFGEERLKSFCLANRHASAASFKDRLVERLEDFLDGIPADDDITLVILKVSER